VTNEPSSAEHLFAETIRSAFDGEPLIVHHIPTYISVPHELLVDSGNHVCDSACFALYGNAYLPMLPARRTRLRLALRRARGRIARLGGLRLVHKDRIDQDRDD
jgi:hypothetical protein